MSIWCSWESVGFDDHFEDGATNHGQVRPTSYRELADMLGMLPVLLREARRARGLSGRAAAADIGMNFSTLNRIEAGARFNSDALFPILRWLDQTRKEATHE